MTEETPPVDYRDTVFLPKTDFPMKAGLPAKEPIILAKWQQAQLYEKRDLNPTTDLRSVLKGLLADQFGLSSAVLSEKIFPDSASARPMQGLIGA